MARDLEAVFKEVAAKVPDPTKRALVRGIGGRAPGGVLPPAARLLIYTPVILPANARSYVANIPAEDTGWKRSKRLRGGDWLGSFTLVGESRDLWAVFNTWLGYHVEERMGTVRWEGLIYELELVADGVSYKRSLSSLGNYVTVANKTTNASGSNAQSIDRYGRRELYLDLGASGEEHASASLQSLRDNALALNSWPSARPTNLSLGGDGGAALLNVTVAGYVHTANWRVMSSTTGRTGAATASATISALISADLEFITEYSVESNSLSVDLGTDTRWRPWDALLRICQLGGSSSYWYAQVRPGRGLVYASLDMSPRYYLRAGALYEDPATRIPVDIFTLEPGVVRNMGAPQYGSPGKDSLFEDARDFLLEEVEVGPGSAVRVIPADLDETGAETQI